MTGGHFALIIRGMTNRQVKTISFMFNNAGQVQNAVCDRGCVSLINAATVASGATVQLAPWGFAIIER